MRFEISLTAFSIGKEKLVTLTILHNTTQVRTANKTQSVELEIISDESQVEGLTSRKLKALFGLLEHGVQRDSIVKHIERVGKSQRLQIHVVR